MYVIASHVSGLEFGSFYSWQAKEQIICFVNCNQFVLKAFRWGFLRKIEPWKSLHDVGLNEYQ